MLAEHLPKPGDGKIFVCGPPGLMKHVSGTKAKDKSQGDIDGLLKELGYSASDVYKF
jgi:cytochrome-b5 reductase